MKQGVLQSQYRSASEKEAAEEQVQELNTQRRNLELYAANLQEAAGSGTPTTQTPISEKILIPNSRVKSSTKKVGQPGHSKAKLEKHPEYEITKHVVHKESVYLDYSGKLKKTGADVTKDITDFYLVIDKIRHYFPKCRCKKCGKISCMTIPNRLK